MEASGLAAVATYVMREQQHLGCLRVRDGAITLEKMFFQDEIREVGDIAPKRTKVEKREREMADALIEQFTGSFDPGRYRDTYRDALLERIRAKRKGETVAPPPPPEAEEPEDLLAALRASVDAAKRSRAGAGKAKRAPARKQGGRKRAGARR